MEYNAIGNGDVHFSASINSLTDNVDVEDCDWWDTAKTNRLSEYNQLIQSNTSLTHSDEAYTYSHSSTRNILEIPVSNLSEPFMFEVDILFSSGNGFEDGLTIFDLFNPETTVWNNTLELAQYPNTKGFGGYRNNTWTIHNRTNSNPNFNVWLKFRATIYENTVKGEVINLNNNSVLFNATINYSALNLKCGILMKNGSCNGKFKNIKIKKLA